MLLINMSRLTKRAVAAGQPPSPGGISEGTLRRGYRGVAVRWVFLAVVRWPFGHQITGKASQAMAKKPASHKALRVSYYWHWPGFELS